MVGWKLLLRVLKGQQKTFYIHDRTLSHLFFGQRGPRITYSQERILLEWFGTFHQLELHERIYALISLNTTTLGVPGPDWH